MIESAAYGRIKILLVIGENNRKSLSIIMAQPVWKVVLYGLESLLMILIRDHSSTHFFGGVGFAWYFAKETQRD